MNTQRVVTASFMIVLIDAGCVFAWRYLAPADRSVEVQQLQTKLIAQAFDDNLSKWTLDRTTESLMREVDQLKEEERKEAWKAVGEKYRQWHLEAAREWNALPESERHAYLESRLTESRKWHRVFYAMRSDAPRVPKRFRKSYLASQEAASDSGEQSAESSSERRGDRRKNEKASDNDPKRSSGSRDGDRRR
ncbi:MAG: hypothetical protein MI757_12115, partial [Pirellulales bacterium]|nr:hypothetical protein [Pirellulales bacterium]